MLHIWLFIRHYLGVLVFMNPQVAYFLAIIFLSTNPSLTKPAISRTRKSGCQYSGYCKPNINIYVDWLIDGDCMENNPCRLQWWALDTVNIHSEAIKNMMWIAGSGEWRRVQEFQLCLSLMGSDWTTHSRDMFMCAVF